MRKVYDRIVLTLVTATLILLAFMLTNTVKNEITNKEQALREIIQDAATSIGRTEKAYAGDLALLEEDYLNRAQAIEFMTIDEGMASPDSLRTIREIMGVQAISLLSADGGILLSTDTALTGQNAFSDPETATTLATDSYAFQIDQAATEDRPAFFYVFLKTSSETYPLIRVDANMTRVPLKSQAELIRTTLERASTEYGTIIMAVSAKDGAILGQTENNIQDIAFPNVTGPEERLDYIRELRQEPYRFMVLNGSVYMAAVQEEDSIYLVGLKNMNSLLLEAIQQTGSIAVFLLLTCGGLILVIYWLMKKYLFDDLDRMEAGIRSVLKGDYTRDLPACRLKELQIIVRAVHDLENGYIEKSQRMNRIFGSISAHIGVFECAAIEGASFYSDSLWQILKTDPDSQQYFRQHPGAFKGWLSLLLHKKNADGLVDYKGSYLDILTATVGRDMIGVVIDRTREEKEKQHLEDSLALTRQKQITDALTGIRNRGGFSEAVTRYLAQPGSRQGTLLLLDIDHFKQINDTYGHPEGDNVLIRFARTLEQAVRSSDLVGRLGGDEFAVFLPVQMSEEALKGQLDRIMGQMQAVFADYADCRAGVSIGAVRLKAGQKTDYPTLYRMADAALYRAKKSGKNQYDIQT